jgi:DNA modification methylase
MNNQILQGDCLDKLKDLPDNSVDSVVTDPPYGLSFMGKKWDYDVPSAEIWKECLRVLKPGGYLLAFAGTRTQHRMAVNIEDAGFEIRDMIAWVYGSGFPKSRNITLDMDKMEGHPNRGHRIAVANRHHPDGTLEPNGEILPSYEPKSDNAKKWNGWGTALKPALEPITVARKPLSEKTVAENCLKWGTGGINIDGCRVEYQSEQDKKEGQPARTSERHGNNQVQVSGDRSERSHITGRFPANLIHDGSDEVVEGFPNESSRFFYCAKASKKERNLGCEELEEKAGIRTNAPRQNEDLKTPTRTNNHPTVKPLALMEYLIRLVTPKGGVVLDPFAGSGTTLIAAKSLGYSYIGIERESEYVAIATARIEAVQVPMF